MPWLPPYLDPILAIRIALPGPVQLLVLVLAELLVAVAGRRITVEFVPLFEAFPLPSLALWGGLSWSCRHVAVAERIPAADMAPTQTMQVLGQAATPAGYTNGSHGWGWGPRLGTRPKCLLDFCSGS
jgi:hypothetical protein